MSRPPLAGRDFFKAHGHGNDYVVFRPGDEWAAHPEGVRLLCDPHRGVGADGIVVVDDSGHRPALRMFNPDGGEFERSGNGLRVAAIALRTWGIASSDRFVVGVGGGDVTLEIHGRDALQRWDVSAVLGTARVGPDAIGMDAGVLSGGGQIHHPELGPFDVVPVSVGNPHLVVFTPDLSDATLHALGPFLATHSAISNGTNVQLAAVEDPGVRIRIWERGVGPTSASGTSASAVAVAAIASGRLAPGSHVIRMDGGEFTITVDGSLDVVLRGPITEVMEGQLTAAFSAALGR